MNAKVCRCVEGGYFATDGLTLWVIMGKTDVYVFYPLLMLLFFDNPILSVVNISRIIGITT
ncbi:hypothetical protein [Mastigocoleus sp. MO_188.B34]|uniref:hypothetical protein n=1 Tax=Mastigocoleus sp. MO_188.B34 TaxID=3036635 RepID=UPI0026023C34|nr:hypothetical protein [Mastigocoleus sp. MO_188.B34]MDJ0694111.1 hypothetical protein [Mastigocoleus sp. MO_188.B34]